jgi:hypothetical protein
VVRVLQTLPERIVQAVVYMLTGALARPLLYASISHVPVYPSAYSLLMAGLPRGGALGLPPHVRLQALPIDPHCPSYLPMLYSSRAN